MATRRENLDDERGDLPRATAASGRKGGTPVPVSSSVLPLAPLTGPGAFVPFAEVDMRTSIRPTIAEVDLAAIRRNFQLLSERVSPAEVWAVIKADAYGHGAVSVARALAAQSRAFAVSLVEEGLELRAAGIRGPIIVLGAYYDQCHLQVIEEGLTPVIYDWKDLELFSSAATRRGVSLDVHVKVDTGMSRLGVAPADLVGMLGRASSLAGVRVSGLCTHFANADSADEGSTVRALALFENCLDQAGFANMTIHAANSAAAVRFPRARFSAVRPGLALYGAMPSSTVGLPELQPALRLSTRLMAIREIQAGVTVSYGGRWTATRPSRIGTLPIGYADGYPRHVEGASVLLRGRRVPIVGAVCMDMLMIDLTDLADIPTVGDPVTLIGAEGDQTITVDDIAGWAGTVNYEILCGISKRVPRIYKD